MKSLERRFNNIVKLNPKWSSLICFGEAVTGQNFSRITIAKYFNKCVEKSDYDKKDKREILKCLVAISANPEKVAEDEPF